ncbi:GrlR family regulatory protein [Bradyrhizobium sp. SZCCHNRI20481]|uniref:GrlR family regulatory protein n=1 Tax=Bradyrhizobium sp. SZCCHNRI20481 TaxID=3057286 RepID=UPI0029161A63|nr:GrlR family regulatory protein [Bradyrhizobium sp. SZCCHNRI20481]
MLADGFYSVLFKTPRGEGAGVVVLAGGQLRGGDSGIAYSGTFAQNGDDFTAKVVTSRHAQGNPSVFGIDAATISLTGKSSSTSATCVGTAAQAPGLTFQAVLNRISD